MCATALADTLFVLGRLQRKLGKLAPAEACFSEALALRRGVLSAIDEADDEATAAEDSRLAMWV